MVAPSYSRVAISSANADVKRAWVSSWGRRVVNSKAPSSIENDACRRPSSSWTTAPPLVSSSYPPQPLAALIQQPLPANFEHGR